MPPITLYFLQRSRSIRTAWLLEELNLPYDLKFSDREGEKAPAEFKAASGNPLGKFPTLRDGDLTVYESGAISEYVLFLLSHMSDILPSFSPFMGSIRNELDTYLCETYDKSGQLLPHNPPQRIKVRQWVYAAEAAFALHGLAILYARWNMPADAPPHLLEAVEKGMSTNVQNDMAWLENELQASKGEFLLGEKVTAADIMMQFSAEFILARELGVKGKEYPRVRRWLEKCKATEGYQRAVKKTGHKL